MKEEGDQDHVGEIRLVSPFGWYEEITAVTKGQTIEYRVIKGPFPAKNYHAQIEFNKVEGEDHTQIVWTGEFEANLFMAPILKPILRSVYSSMMANIAKAAKNAVEATI